MTKRNAYRLRTCMHLVCTKKMVIIHDMAKPAKLVRRMPFQLSTSVQL